MRLVNWFFKGLGYIGIHVVCIIECFLISACLTGIVDIIGLSVYSAVAVIPSFIVKDLWKWYAISCIPLTLVFFLVIVFDLLNLYRKGKELRRKGREAMENQEVESKK